LVKTVDATGGGRCPWKSVALALVHDVEQRLAFDEAANVLLDSPDHALAILVRAAGDAWSDDDVLARPQIFLP